MSNLVPVSVSDAIAVAKELASSGMVPRDYAGKPGAIYAAIDLGASVGLRPMQAVQGIASINGRPALWGDAALGVVMAHPKFVAIDEDAPDVAAKQGFGRCKITRQGCEPYEVRFTVDMAKAAGLWGKAGPWSQYPGRMLQMRARSWAFRDRFPDALKGIGIAEEVADIPPAPLDVVSFSDDMMPTAKAKATDGLKFPDSSTSPSDVVTEVITAPVASKSAGIPDNADRVKVVIKTVDVGSGNTNGKPWTRYRFTLAEVDPDGTPFEATTFSSTIGEELRGAVGMEGVAILTKEAKGVKLWGMDPC